MNITFTYYYHGMEDVLYEERMVGPRAISEKATSQDPQTPNRSSS